MGHRLIHLCKVQLKFVRLEDEVTYLINEVRSRIINTYLKVNMPPHSKELFSLGV